MLSIVSKTGLTFFVILFSGCATFPSVSARYSASETFAAAHGFKKSYIKTGQFTLASYTRFKQTGRPIHIYIEGDGASWVTRTRLSNDPTPLRPLVLELASLDSSDNVAYLARPGQYSSTGFPDCGPSYWSSRRFSPEIIGSMDQAVSKLAMQAGSGQIDLIGYSGGAAIAVLVAARRHDIASIKTIAGNLDPEMVNRLHHVSPLQGSLDPMDVADKIKDIPQRHFVGTKDTVVTLGTAQAFVRKEGDKDYRRITVIDGISHTKGWQEYWQKLQNLNPL